MSRTRWIAAFAAASLALAIPGLSTAAQAAPGDFHDGYGYVRDTYNGNDLTGVTVTARSGSASGTVVEITSTDDGRFDFEDLPEGPIYLQFEDPSGKVEGRTNGPFQVDRGNYQFGDAYLETYRGILTGTVSQSDGSAPWCGEIQVYRANQAGSYFNSSGFGGKTFSLWLPVGDYKLKFRNGCENSEVWIGGTDHASATSQAVTKNATTSFGAFVLPAPLAISGTVRSDAGNALLGNITVQARTATTDELRGQVQTRANGTYALTGLAPDKYVLRFTDQEGEFIDEYYGNSPTVGGATWVQLGSSSETGKNISLAKAAVTDDPTVNLKGVVTNFAGKGLTDIEVELFNIGQNKWVGASSYTSRNGAYSFQNIEPGTYRIEFDDDYEDDDRPEYFDKSITVVVGSTKLTLPAVKLVGEATISGRVSLPATSTANEIWGEVSAWDLDGNEVESTNLNRNGTYELDDLEPGTYKLRFEAEREFSFSYERMISQWWSNKYTISSATALTVGDSAVRTGVNAKLGKSLVATAAPRVTGTAKQGKTLRASAGAWNVVVGTKFTYAWFRNGKAIKGATKASYKLTKSDRKKSIKVRVAASNPANGWKSGLAYSAGKKVSKK